MTRSNPGDKSGVGVPNFEFDYVPEQEFLDIILSFKGCGAELGNAMKIFTTAQLGKDYSGLKLEAQELMLELDDVHRGSMFHPGAVVIPAVFALGEKMRVSGLDLLTAIVVGYEAGVRIGEAAGEAHYETWHTTGYLRSFRSGSSSREATEFG
jgi:hypothetical protein